MEFSRWKNIYVVLLMSVPLAFGLFFIANISRVSLFIQPALVVNSIAKNPLPEKLENPPEIIKAVYITENSAGSKKYLNYLSDLFSATEINAVVVDIKDSEGKIGDYDTDNLIRFFHDKNIYVIGRIAVFEDPVYAKAHPELAVYNKIKPTTLWKDNNGLEWLDPASKDVWDYNIGLAKNGFSHGFDEINFDYIRYPSDGKSSNMGFPISDPRVTSQSVIKEFFEYTRKELTGERISVDLFGQTTINKDDMGIGQLIENAFESFDYISPMVYPSHYIDGFIGFKNPAEHPYEVVKYSLDSAEIRKNVFANKNGEAAGTPASELKLNSTNLAKFRPWLQDFNMGAVYDATAVSNEIQATKDSLGQDYNGFMLWNPSNIYTLDAILK